MSTAPKMLATSSRAITFADVLFALQDIVQLCIVPHHQHLAMGASAGGDVAIWNIMYRQCVHVLLAASSTGPSLHAPLVPLNLIGELRQVAAQREAAAAAAAAAAAFRPPP